MGSKQISVRKSAVKNALFAYDSDMLIRYARVSTEDQQLDALKWASCERIFEEKGSGRAGMGSPALKATLAFLRPEDQLMV